MENNKATCIFRGAIHRKIYKVYSHSNFYDGYSNAPEIRCYSERVQYKTFYEKVILLPTYKRDEEVYINELDINVTIRRIIRSTNEETIYITDYVIETIEDEKSTTSKIQADNDLKTEIIKCETYNKKVLKNQKKWFEFWK